MTNRDLDRVLDGITLGRVFDDTEFYPGSKQRRGQPAVIVAEGVTPGFDFAHESFVGLAPRKYTVNGIEVEFFTLGQLAKALRRSPVTIRKWEADGTLPKATFVAPNPKKDARAKRRLYSRARPRASSASLTKSTSSGTTW